MAEAKELEVPERRASDDAGPVEMPNPAGEVSGQMGPQFKAR
jgi:hypothetical protein